MILAGVLGFVLAWMGSVPMSGPVAMLFVSRALAGHRRVAVLIALGGGLVEAAYAFGAALLLPRLLGRTREIVLGSLGLGALVIFALGAILLLRPRLLERTSEGGGRRGFLHGALSSLFNPTLVATWTLAVGALYANGFLEAKASEALVFAAGVAAGSLSWFAFVLFLAALLRVRPTAELRRKALRVAGALMVASGLALAVRFVAVLRSPGEPRPPSVPERIPKFIEQHTKSTSS